MAAALGSIPLFGSAFAAAAGAVMAAIAPVAVVVLIVVAVVCVVAIAATLIYRNRDKISSFFEKAYEKGKALVGAAATAVAGAIDNAFEKARLLFALVALASASSIVESKKAKRETTDPSLTVYRLVDVSTGITEYVGRTKDVNARRNAHSADKKRGHLRFVIIAPPPELSYNSMRGLEQAMMLQYKTIKTVNKMNNQINGISPNNKSITIYMEALRGIAEYLENQISNEYLNWTGK